MRKIQSALDLLEPDALRESALLKSLTAHREADALASGTRFGPYAVVRELGRGGMGVVYLAERVDGELQQTVAIKCVARATFEQRAQLFRSERQLLSELEHPNIARLIEVGSDAQWLWFAMECIDGVPLDQYLSTLPNEPKARISLLLQLIDAVDAAHQRLLIHRDIKPANVLVDAQGLLKLLDFGIASWQHDAQAIAAFSPNWASPEQLRLQSVTPASDQYQIGRLLQLALSSCVVKGQRGRELAAIVNRATHEDAVQRYRSVAEFGADLRAWTNLQPVQAIAGGWIYSLRCAIRRKPWTAALSGGAMVAALASLLWVSAALKFERDIAQAAASRAERAQRVAEAERVRQTKLVNFLTNDVLFQGDLYEGKGLNATLFEVLQSAESKLLNGNAVDAADVLPMLAALVESYESNYRFDDAQRVARAGIELGQRVQGAEARGHLFELRSRLASLYGYSGNPEKSIPLLQQIEVSAIAEDAIGTIAINASADLAFSAYQASDFPLMRQTLGRLKPRLLPPDQLANDERDFMLYGQQIYALLRGIDGDAEGAELRLQAVRKSLRKRFDEQHATVVRLDRNLAVLWREYGQCGRGLARLEDLLRVKLPDAEHSWNQHELGAAHVMCGSLPRAVELLEQAVQTRQALLSENHWRVVSSKLWLAEALRKSNQAVRAQQVMGAICEPIRLQFDDKHWQYARCLSELALINAKLKRPDAREQAARALAVLREQPPYVHRQGRLLHELELAFAE